MHSLNPECQIVNCAEVWQHRFVILLFLAFYRWLTATKEQGATICKMDGSAHRAQAAIAGLIAENLDGRAKRYGIFGDGLPEQ